MAGSPVRSRAKRDRDWEVGHDSGEPETQKRWRSEAGEQESQKRRKIEEKSEIQLLRFPSQASLDKLPDPLQLMILVKLPPTDLLSLSQTCKGLYRVYKDETAWKGSGKKWVEDRSFTLIAQARRNDHETQTLGESWQLQQRKRLCEDVKEAAKLGRHKDSHDKNLFLLLLSTDKALLTTNSKAHQDQQKAKDQIEFLYMVFARSCKLWRVSSRAEKVKPSDTTWQIQSPKAMRKWHRLHILCKALQAMTCYICNTIAADILSRISQDEKLNVWTLVEAWFKKLARFLELWGKVELRSEVEGHISSGIINTFIRKAGKGRSPYPLPPLDDLGKLAFRSQVLLNYNLKKRLVQELKDSIANKHQASRGCSSAKEKRKFLEGFCGADFPRSKKSAYTLSTFTKTYGL